MIYSSWIIGFLHREGEKIKREREGEKERERQRKREKEREQRGQVGGESCTH